MKSQERATACPRMALLMDRTAAVTAQSVLKRPRPRRLPERPTDGGFSGESPGGSGRRRHRTPEEQAEHDRRKAERQLGDRDADRHRERSEKRDHHDRPDKSQRLEKHAERTERSDRASHRDHAKSRETDSPTDRSRHRSSRRHSHSSQQRSERVPSAAAPAERAEPVASPQQPDKKFFDVKNAQGVVGSGMPPQIAGETVVEMPAQDAKGAPEGPKRSSTSRSKHSLKRTSTDQARPKAAKAKEHEDTAQSSNKSSGTPSEDSARKARRSERERERERDKKSRDEDKKPSGLKGMFRRIFG